ncbi:MAG: hypothetical protein V1767_06245 [Chloroflexota bacterium]
MGNRKVLTVILILAGIISLVFGGAFVYQGFSKANLITAAMQTEKAAYASADGEIEGIIDNTREAAAMAGILKEHRMAQGIYTELKRDDPKRQTILNAMTMENSLNLAQLSYGVTDIAKANGAFMAVVGVALILSGVSRSRINTVD